MPVPTKKKWEALKSGGGGGGGGGGEDGQVDEMETG